MVVFVFLIYKINAIEKRLDQLEAGKADPSVVSLEERIDALYAEPPIYGSNEKALITWKQL